MDPHASHPFPRRRPWTAATGLTLWELLATLLVAGTLAAIGTPWLRTLVLDARQTADLNAFVTAVQLARSEAEKRARPVVLCKSSDRRACAGIGTGFDDGWIVLIRDTERSPTAGPADLTPVLAHVPRTDGPIHANRDSFEFRPFQRRSTNGTVTFCDARGAARARAVIISYTGRPRVAAEGPGGRTLECPPRGS